MPLISEINIWFAKSQLEICREYSKEMTVITLFDCFHFQRYTSVIFSIVAYSGEFNIKA